MLRKTMMMQSTLIEVEEIRLSTQVVLEVSWILCHV